MRRLPPFIMAPELSAVSTAGPCSTSAISRRYLRIRSAAGHPSAILRAASLDDPATQCRRPPPAAMTLDYILEKLPSSIRETYQTESAVWGANTFREAWQTLHQLHQKWVEPDPMRATRLYTQDRVGLAMANAYAETLHLLSLFPPSLRQTIVQHPSFSFTEVEEFFLHVGQSIEIRGSGAGGWVMQLPPPSADDLTHLLQQIGRFGADGRGCIAHTAHRVSVWRARDGTALGLTVRVGRFVPNVATALRPLAEQGSVLILSRAGVGKTTLLRDLASSLAQGPRLPRVAVVDTSNEIGGDGAMPLPYLGRCRRIQVPQREEQGNTMTEVIQNHSPEYLIVDEISTAAEAQAAWSIAQRGVHLIATCHGESLAGLLQNQSLNLLVGGAAQAFLSNEERRLRNKQKKTVLERPYSSPFEYVVELQSRDMAHVYFDVNRAVDLILDDQLAKPNAAVGEALELRQSLPASFRRRLQVRQQKRGASTKATIPLGEFEDMMEIGSDSDGYRSYSSEPQGQALDPQKASSSQMRHGPNRSGHRNGGKQRSRVSDAELLENLNGFL